MQTIATLKEGDWVEETYLATAKTVATAKNGVTYLSLKLADKTGEINGRMWDNAEEAAGRFEREDFVRVKGMVANYQGTMQIKMKLLEKVDDAKVDIGNFIQASVRSPDDMERELAATVKGIQNTHLKRLMEAFLKDASFMESFKRAPAAKTMHHNYVGGLLEHVLELMALCRDVAKHFPSIDLDLLLVGAFLHDIGKTRELNVRKTIEYTTEGRLIGHISLGYEMLVEKIETIPGFPEETAMLLRHILLSHHGEYEFGSPKLPMTLEAIALHYLDNLDSKMYSVGHLMREDANTDSHWTPYQAHLGRKLFKGEQW